MDKKTKAIAATAILLIIIMAILFATFYHHVYNPRPTPQVYEIVDGRFTVDPGSYKAYNFTVLSDSLNIVSGTFNVTTPNSTGFRLFIWDNAAFANWQKNGASLILGFGTISFFDSDHLTNGTIRTSSFLSGTYWLIYTNNSTEPMNVTSEATFLYGF